MLLWFFVCLFIMLVLDFPIYLSLIGASLLYILFSSNLSIMVAIQKLINAPNSFTLLAVPFFILAGQIMNTGGITNRIFRFAENLVGHFRGGLGYVNVLASMLFAGMSGSAVADAGGLGLVEIKAMRDAGYHDDFTVGVTAASSIVGPIIPPSIPMVVYGAVANVSIGALFIGGIIPGILICLALCVQVYFQAKTRDYPTAKRASLKELYASFKEAFFALLTPFIIIGGIWFGFFTPTEAALVSTIYAIIVTVFIYKEFNLKNLPALLLETVKMVGPAIVIVSAANIFGWIMNYERVDQYLLKLLFSITTNKYMILLIINLILLVLGMFLEVVAGIMIMLPLLQPVIAHLGINPVHFGLIIVLNLMIGLLTPPVGFVLYVLSSITKIPADTILKMVLPWMIPLLIALLLVTYIPGLVLFLPRLLGFA